MIAYDGHLPKEPKFSDDEKSDLKQQIHVHEMAMLQKDGRLLVLTKSDLPMLEKQNYSPKATGLSLC